MAHTLVLESGCGDNWVRWELPTLAVVLYDERGNYAFNFGVHGTVWMLAHGLHVSVGPVGDLHITRLPLSKWGWLPSRAVEAVA